MAFDPWDLIAIPVVIILWTGFELLDRLNSLLAETKYRWNRNCEGRT